MCDFLQLSQNPQKPLNLSNDSNGYEGDDRAHFNPSDELVTRGPLTTDCLNPVEAKWAKSHTAKHATVHLTERERDGRSLESLDTHFLTMHIEGDRTLACDLWPVTYVLRPV